MFSIENVELVPVYCISRPSADGIFGSPSGWQFSNTSWSGLTWL
jgi:hypothetical protein